MASRRARCEGIHTVGYNLMVHPKFPGDQKADMFICGNDAGAKETVSKLTRSLGWDVIDTGDITGSRLLEPMCVLWVKHAIQMRSRAHAFKFLRA